MAVNENLGILALAQAIDDKAVDQALRALASKVGESVDDVNNQLNKISIDKDVMDNIVNQLKSLPEEVRKKTQGMSFDLFSELINADGAEEKIDEAFKKFSSKIQSFGKLRDQIGNDKIIIETDLSDLDKLADKMREVIELESQLKGKRGNAKKKIEVDLKSAQNEVDTWIQARQQIEKYDVSLEEVKGTIAKLANEFRDKKLGSFNFIDKNNIKEIQEMVGWLEQYVKLSGDSNLSGLKNLGIKGGVMDLSQLYRGEIDTNDSNLRKQYQEYADVIKKYISLIKTINTNNVNNSVSGINTQELKEQREEIDKLKKSLEEKESQLEQVNQKYNEQKNIIEELEKRQKALENTKNPKIIESDEYKRITEELTSAKNRADELEKKLSETRSTVNVLSDSLQAYDTNNLVPKKDFENAERVIKNLTDQVNELENKLKESEKNVSSLSEEMGKMQQDKSSLNEELSKQKEINNAQQEQISNLEKVKSELEETKKKYQEVLNEINNIEKAQANAMGLLDNAGRIGAFNNATKNVNYNEGIDAPKDFVNFDYLEKAKQKIQEARGEYEELVKAAVYYHQYLQKGGTEPILDKNGKDVSNDLLSIYEDMSRLVKENGEISEESVLKYVKAANEELTVKRQQVKELKEEVSALKEKEKELEKLKKLEETKSAEKPEQTKKTQTESSMAKSADKTSSAEDDFKRKLIERQKKRESSKSEVPETHIQDSSSILSEQQALEKLEQAVRSVTIAIAEKNKAIQAEEVQMDLSVNQEIAKLEELKGKLNEIKTEFGNGIASELFKNTDDNGVTTSSTTPVAENIVNDNAVEEQNKDLEEQQFLYNNIIRLLTEYVSLQDKVNSGNKDIVDGESDYINLKDIRKQTGKVSQNSVKNKLNHYLRVSKNENGDYNDNYIKKAKNELAAYVADFGNAEKAAEIFGNKNKELFNEICQMIDQAKISLDAYNKAQMNMDIARSQLSELNKIQTGENLKMGQVWKLEDIVKTDGIETAIKYITDELGIKIPEAAKKAESAISEVNDELNKPQQQKVQTVESQTGNEQEDKKSDVNQIPIEPLIDQTSWEKEIDRILEAIGTKKIKIEPDTTSQEWNDFKTFINEISNKVLNLKVESNINNDTNIEEINLPETTALEKTEKNYDKIIEAARKANSELGETVKVIQSINKAGEVSFKVSDDKGNSVNLSKDKFSSNSIVKDDITYQKELQKQLAQQEKHAKEVAEAQRKYEEQLLAEKKKREAEYTSWWEKELSTREQIQQKRDKETWDEQVRQQKEQEKREKELKEIQQKRDKETYDANVSEANKIANEQLRTWEKIYKVKAQIAKLNPNNEADRIEIEALKERERILQETFNTQKQQLDGLDRYYNKQEHNRKLNNISDLGNVDIRANSDRRQNKINNDKIAEANRLLTAQQRTYEDIYSIEAKIAKLDPDDKADSKKIEALNQEKKLLQEQFLIQKKQLDSLTDYYNKQDQNKALADIAKVGQKNIEANAADLQKRLDRQSSSAPASNASTNLVRVNALYDQQLATIKEINALKSIDEDARTVSQNERLAELNNELLSIHQKIDEELNSEYTKTEKIQKVLDEMVATRDKVNNQGTESISVNQNSFTGRETDIAEAYEEAQKINDALNRTSILMDELSKRDIENFDKPLNNANIRIEQLNQRLASGRINLADYDKAINRTVTSLRNIVKVLDDTATKTDGLNAIQDYLRDLSGGDFKIINTSDTNGITTLTAEFVDQNKQLQRLKISYNDVNKQISNLGSVGRDNVTSLSKFIDELGVKFRNLSTYLLSFVSFYEIWGAIKQGVTYVREFDTALTEMKKVSDETTESLKNFQGQSFEIADSLGATAKVIQDSTADWMRKLSLVPLYGNI